MKIEYNFQKTTDDFLNLVSNLKGKVLDFRPQKNFWTIRENIIHTIDSELNAYLRLKTIITEPGRDTFIINDEAWIKNTRSKYYDIEEYIDLFTCIRKIELRIIRKIDFNYYSENYVEHKDYGQVKLSTWLDWYSVEHIKTHIELIKRNLEMLEQ